VFKRDPNNSSNVECKACGSSLVTRKPDLQKHLITDKCKKALSNPNRIDKYVRGVSEAKTEIQWAFITVTRNLSFLLSDHVLPIFQTMFFDSKVVSSMIVNRHKTEAIIDNVILGAAEKNVTKGLQNTFSICFDHSRDISNNNEFMLTGAYFEEKPKPFIRRTVLEVLEQNTTKAEETFDTVNSFFDANRISFQQYYINYD